MKKRNFLIAGIAALLLSSCGQSQTIVIEATDRNYTPEVQSFRTNKVLLTLSVGEKSKLSADFIPAEAYKNTIIFESSDEEVATVNEDGEVEALKAGQCNITVSIKDSNIAPSIVPVEVYNKVKAADMSATIDPLMASMAARQRERFGNVPSVSKASMEWIQESQKYKNDVLLGSGISYEAYTVDTNEAYFSVGGTDKSVKVADGTPEVANFRWSGYTTDQYQTFLFHDAGSTKTYLSLGTQSYMSKTRFDAILDAFGSLFSSGKKLVNRALEWGLSTSDLTTDYSRYKSLITGGFYNENSVGYELVQNNYQLIIEPADESSYDIPAYTTVFQDYDQKIYWRDGACLCMDVSFILRYDINEDHYEEYTTRTISMKVAEDVHYEVPDKDFYKQVDSIFDL